MKASEIKPGMRFVSWLILSKKIVEYVTTKKGTVRRRYFVWCECECGNVCKVEPDRLIAGRSSKCKSCSASKTQLETCQPKPHNSLMMSCGKLYRKVTKQEALKSGRKLKRPDRFGHFWILEAAIQMSKKEGRPLREKESLVNQSLVTSRYAGNFVKCGTCGETIYRTPHQLKSRKNHYCSRDCQYKGRSLGHHEDVQWNVRRSNSRLTLEQFIQLGKEVIENGKSVASVAAGYGWSEKTVRKGIAKCRKQLHA